MAFVPDTVKQGYGTKWSFKAPTELLQDAPKGYKSRISRRFLEKYAEAVKVRTRENFDARIQGVEPNTLRQQMKIVRVRLKSKHPAARGLCCNEQTVESNVCTYIPET